MKNEFHDKRNRWSGLKVRPLITLVLVLSIIIPIPFFSTAAEKFDPEEPCSLTVTVNNTNMGEDYSDLAKANLVIDLYKVADVVPYERSDGYTFKLLELYEGSEESEGLQIDKEMNAEKWRELSQEAARIVLDESTGTAKINPDITTVTTDPPAATIEIDELKAGLYLLVVRNDDANIGDDGYVDTTKDGTIVTRAFSDTNSYIFLPELVSLPTKEPEDGVVNTANTGEWQYDVNVFLKPERESASLRIVKAIDRFFVNGGSVTFVFEIEAELNGRSVYDNVVSIVFDGSSMEEELLIENIPVGATVTVTEVYSGAYYTVEGSGVEIRDITSNLAPTEFEFKNNYDERQTGGHGITNHFTYEEDGWDWEQIENASQG